MARWGMPSPTFAIAGKKTDPGVTNIRNVKSPHWRRWLGVESRCIVPFTSFAENEVLPDGSRPPVWFAFDDSRPLAFFAGIWTRWTSVRKVREGETTNDLFGFLTTEPNTMPGPAYVRVTTIIEECEGRYPKYISNPDPARTESASIHHDGPSLYKAAVEVAAEQIIAGFGLVSRQLDRPAPNADELVDAVVKMLLADSASLLAAPGRNFKQSERLWPLRFG